MRAIRQQIEKCLGRVGEIVGNSAAGDSYSGRAELEEDAQGLQSQSTFFTPDATQIMTLRQVQLDLRGNALPPLLAFPLLFLPTTASSHLFLLVGVNS